ncbi:hypothetical protein MNB_SV-15-144 [hydrothermal vent metagenome]|uniref:Methyltransferase domain-containing protein n=1 Tax=hydrothermal vent metagenome TaxID=652676 RepID=A0A1W1EL76_9ZZZZ
MNSLDLYANIEDLLGLDEAKEVLNSYYFDTLSHHTFDSIIDIGCGKGEFLAEIKDNFEPQRVLGVDISDRMVEESRSRGVEAKNIDICEIKEKFDVVTAIFDMLNYLDKSELKIFLGCVEDILEDDGLFLLDINSLDGFEEVAVGSFIVDDDSRFLTIDSDFDGEVYSSDFTLFIKDEDKFIKNKATINQYYHSIEEIEKLSNLKLIDTQKISLYEEVDDKILLMFKNIR